MKDKVFISLIVMMILIMTIVPTTLAGTTATDTVFYCKDMTEGIIALKEISSLKLTLSNGSILSTAVSQTETAVNIEENMKNVEFVLILDASGSMSGQRNEITKSATQELTDALFDKIGEDHLKMGTIFFSSDIGETLALTNNKDEIKSQLSRLPASGGTYISSALNRAKEWLTATDSPDTIKIVCTLSDGAIADNNEAKTAFEAIHAANISTMSIFVETSIGEPFSSLPEEHHKNFTTTTVGLSETIATDIYNEIYFRIILMMNPKTTYDISNAAILAGDKIVITADEEIIHGATLQVEYVFIIIAAFDVANIEIKDIPENFTFNPNQKLLTENKTNNDYYWQYDAGSNTIVSRSGNIHQESTKAYKVKLVLNTLVTPEILSGTGTFSNCAEFTLKKDGGEVIQINQNTADDPEETRIKALDILMIPPTGDYFTYVLDRTIGVSAIMIAISLATIVIYMKGHSKILRKRD